MRKPNSLSKSNYAVPGKPLSLKEMEQMLQEAQNGQFHSMEVVKAKIKEWKTKFAK